MNTVLNIAQIIIVILLVACVLLQQRGDGMGAAFGGSDQIVSVRRGPEKILFWLTIVFAVLFFAISLYRMFAN
ncbi:MAG: preprotein translocase subunit SecG [Candidatus Kerfeldbacteria bacterium]|nr:preprotein translocase subunit SecG [Candidatus Kerfeldbacteria bacterium]